MSNGQGLALYVVLFSVIDIYRVAQSLCLKVVEFCLARVYRCVVLVSILNRCTQAPFSIIVWCWRTHALSSRYCTFIVFRLSLYRNFYIITV